MTAIHQSRELAGVVAEKLKVYAQPQRLMILSCLLEGERTVAQVDEVTGIGQPALSQQLAELRRAGVVLARRAAREVHYRLADDGITLCVRTLEAMFGGHASAVEPGAGTDRLAAETPRAQVASPGAAVFATVRHQP